MLIRPIWNDGQAFTTPEMQRPCDVAAGADDRVAEFLCSPGLVQKRVYPLTEETVFSPDLLIGGNQGGADSGKVIVLPAQFVVGDATNQNKIVASALLNAVLKSQLVTSNGSADPRVDLLYATVARSVPAVIASPPAGTAFCGIGQANPSTGAQQSRKIKDVSSGLITQQTVNIYDVPSLTITILPGTPAPSPVAPSLPADSATAYNISLANINVAAGYVSGTIITQDLILPKWNGGYIQRHRLRDYELPSIYSSGLAEKPTTYISSRWGSGHKFFAHIKLLPTSPTTAGTSIILDSNFIWYNRLIKASVWYLGSAAEYPLEGHNAELPQVGIKEGIGDVGMAWSGLGNNAQGVMRLDYAFTNGRISLVVDTSGRLKFFNSGTIANVGVGDALVLEIEALDQMTVFI